MAARKEILDFIIQEQTTTPPKWQEVEVYALRILEAYNERRADTMTLKNDLYELVASCKMCEQRGIKDATPNFEVAVTLLLTTALEWNICLPESEIKRYENVKLFIIDSLADYIRETYRHHQMWEDMPLSPPKGKKVPTWENLHDENGKLINPEDKKVLELFPNKREYNTFIGSCYCKDGSLQEHKKIVRNYLHYRIQDEATTKKGIPSLLAEFLLRHELVLTVGSRTIQRDFEALLKQDK